VLENTFKFPFAEHKGDYDLRLPVCSTWQDKPDKILLILETVDSEDLKERRLLFSRSKTVVHNLLNYTISTMPEHANFDKKSCAFAVVNFNNYKFFDQPKESWQSHRNSFAKRIRAIIKHLEPTKIIVFGDYATKTLLNKTIQIDNLEKKRGWVFPYEVGKVKTLLSGNLDLYNLYIPKSQESDAASEDDGDGDDDNKDAYGPSNLLFYTSQILYNGLAGKHLYSLKHLKPKYIYIDTIKEFKEFYEKLLLAKRVAVDTETRNGSVNHNAIHTIQFSFDSSLGYVLPIAHPDTPWGAKQLAYIKRKLRSYFIASPRDSNLLYLIIQYSMFDLRILRKELGIPVILHKVWEIQAGTYLLDENSKYLAQAPFSTPHGGLDQAFHYYENDHYKTAAFSKDDRTNSSLTRLDNKDFLEYAAMDVISIFGIHEMQKKRAENFMVGDKPFLPYFKKLVLYQMDSTVHTLSTMRQHGSTVDKSYLAFLKSNSSPLLGTIAKLKKDFFLSPEVQKVNKILIKENGQRAGAGLYGAKDPFIFDLGKYAHKSLLFFSILGLKPVSFTKKAKLPQINRTFIAAYKEDYELVEKFGRYQKSFKLWSTYVKGWWNKIQESVDSKKDFKLRPSYDFFPVVTGRLNSSNPSLQQTPSRGEEAKYIKRTFAAPPGCLHVKFDYSAHEVRVWSIVSKDRVLAAVFKVGQLLRQQFRKTPTDEIKARIKKEGDIHIINVKFFFGIFVDKEHPLRDAIKAIIFGVIYSKGAKALSKDIRPKDSDKQKIIARLKEIKAELNDLQ
jgi:DNA polymerase I-like protein with 3'-5' exonuclease and polymerase domains